MKKLFNGQFHGHTNTTLQMDGITITDTEYTEEKVDWHFHENAYFTFILQGNVMEGNKKEVYHCQAGSLLFHNWQEPHYNIKPKGFTRGFHIELQQRWLDEFNVTLKELTGSINITDPDLKMILHNIFRESKYGGNSSTVAIHSLLLQLLAKMDGDHKHTAKQKPLWVKKIKELLHDQFTDSVHLSQLSKVLDIHPVHLSRDFSKYFHCSMGAYIRKLKLEKSMSMLCNKNKTLSDISFECGYADQSHFARCFKAVNGITPLAYRKIILG